MPDYLMKWKGHSSGPYTVEDLRRMFEDREIGPMHEISFEGNWVTARTFFRRNAATISEPSLQDPVADTPPARSAAESQLPQPSRPGRSSSVSAIRVTPGEAPGPTVHSSSITPHSSRAPGAKDLVLLAGFWQRATALFLDLLLIVGLPIWGLDAYGPHDLFTFSGLLELSLQTWLISGFVFLFAFWLYSALFESSPLRATFGKRALGLVVVRENGETTKFPTTALRGIAKIGSAAILLTGFFLAAFSPRKKTFHDLVSGTAVVYPVPASLRFH